MSAGKAISPMAEAAEKVEDMLEAIAKVRGEPYRDSVSIIVGCYQLMAVISVLASRVNLTSVERESVEEGPSAICSAISRRFCEAVGTNKHVEELHKDARMVFDKSLVHGSVRPK